MLLDIFDPKAAPAAIGIDLGTTHSVVAYVRDGRPVALTNCDGTALLPSVVHYGRHAEVLVGRSARTYLESEPTRTISSVKRFMGRASDDPQTQLLGAYKFATDPSNSLIRFDVGERKVTAVEVSAEILKSLARSARDQLTNVGGAVITVPAYFDDGQRQATKDAGKLAGLNVLRLLNEPTAAALAYGLDKQVNGTFAVYDLGGGTFDITILLLEDGVFQVRSTGGDSALGGDDMDRLIAERMLKDLGIDGREAPKELVGLLLSTARDVKHGLTDVPRVTVTLPGPNGTSREFSLTRSEFEAMIAPLLDRTGKAARRALRDADLEPSALDGVILVGGSTRVPAVRAYVEQLFGRPALSDIDPDLVVGCGAALQAQMLASESDEVLLLDVLPLSLGVETMGGAVSKVLPRNTTIPAGAKSTFTTYADGQTGFELHVVQGERELAKDCRSLARFLLRGIPPMPAGQARLEVEFRVDENNLLRVEARELTTGIQQSVDVQPSYGLTDEQVEDMLIDALDHGEEDFDEGRRVEAVVEAERMLLATQKAFTSDGDLLAPSDKAVVAAALAALREGIDAGASASVLQLRISDLDRATQAWAGQRMNRAIAGALAGMQLTQVAEQVESARGVEAHLREHAGLPSELTTAAEGDK